MQQMPRLMSLSKHAFRGQNSSIAPNAPVRLIKHTTTTLNVALSKPVTTMHDDIDPFVHLTTLGRDIPLCANMQRSRTKLSIIWNCLTTIFACTWVAVHPNVPKQDESRWERLRTRIYDMAYALIGPEAIIMWAIRQRIGAARHLAKYNKTYFPTLKSKTLAESIEDWFSKPSPSNERRWTLKHGFLLEMHGLVYNGKELHDVDELEGPIEVPEKEIDDKSKGDFLAKLIVVLHTTLFIVQCLCRWMSHLPVTELEIGTLAFAVLNIIAYSLWWDKPQYLCVPIQVRKVVPRQDRPMLGEEAGTNDADEEQNPAAIAQHAQVQVRGIRHSNYFGDLDIQKTLEGRGTLFLILVYPFLIFFYALRPLLVILHGGNKGDQVDGLEYRFYSSERALTSMKLTTATLIISVVFGGLHLIPVWVTPSRFG